MSECQLFTCTCTCTQTLPSKHPTLYDVIIWLVLGWFVNNQKLTLVQRHYLIRILYNQSCRH